MMQKSPSGEGRATHRVSSCALLRESLFRDHEDMLVGVALQFGGVDSAAARGEGDEVSGELRPHPVEHVGIAARDVAEVELGAAFAVLAVDGGSAGPVVAADGLFEI